MATLADELLNDFESGSENEDETNEYQNGDEIKDEYEGDLQQETEMGMEVDANEDDMEDAEEETEAKDIGTGDDTLQDQEDTKAKIERLKLGGVRDVRNVAGLMKVLQPVLDKINYYKTIPSEKRTTNIGSIEDNPEYTLLTQANSLSTQIDSEVILVHKFIRDHYSVRFPELETLVSNPVNYAKTVAILKNGPFDNVRAMYDLTDDLVRQPLRLVLDGGTLMTVAIQAASTTGKEMEVDKLQNTIRACKMVLDLENAKRLLTEYVQSRMDAFAPNLTALIGSETAAQMLNFAGGLKALAKTPDRNVPAMGSKKQKQSGLATNIGIRQQGFLYHSDLIRSVPTDLKIQAMRIVSGKLILAARVDSVHQSPDGTTGLQLKEECERRLDKLIEPPPNRGARALPAPDDKPSRKRGGRRARKAKEATAMTDLRKQQNRMAFGKEEREVGYGTGDGTKGLGMIGQENDGRIRATQIDRRTMAKLSKKNPGWGAMGSGTATSLNSAGGMASSLRTFGMGGNATSLRASGLRTSGVGNTAGTASSVAFTPVQGLELVDPKVQAELKRKREAEKAGYFSSGTFTQINNSASKPGGVEGGFKVPSLPLSKKVNMGPPATK